MPKLISSFIVLLFASSHIYTQAIDGSFAFDSDPAKKYSIYVPTSYDENVPNSLMLGLHPLNTNRWNAKAWRDTLVVFAEENGLLLVCPDGGADGRIDDPIDTAFTSILLDSMDLWYNVHSEEKYVMGFSWGGKTSYTYGLRRTDEFQGYLIIGAAVTINEVADVITNAKDESFYLVHGSQDAPAVRFTPLLDALLSVEACVESQLLSGVGHTIDFPDRNAILSEAYQWLSNHSCGISKTHEPYEEIAISPNPFSYSVTIKNLSDYNISLFDSGQKRISYQISGDELLPDANYYGLIFITLTRDNKSITKRILKL